jgi:Protein of unknown function (DUF3568)
MIPKKFYLFILLLLLFSGCATTYEKVNVVEPEQNISHAANQTLSYSVHWVDEATLQVLDQMEIMIIDNGSSPTGTSIKAATIDQDILIELTSLTPNSTEMKINVQYSENTKTKSTANQIFYKTRQFLLSKKPLNSSKLDEPNKSTRNFFPSN